MSSRLLALLALAALLIVPASHGSLSHGHAAIGQASAGIAAASDDGSHLGATGTCRLCLAASQSRTLVASRSFAAVAAPFGDLPGGLPSRLLAPAPVDLTRAAPRAPPTRV